MAQVDIDENRLSHPRRIGWMGTAALAMGGSNQSLFLISALIAGQAGIPGQGSAAIPLLICGLLLGWAAAPGWTELILIRPDRVGGIAAACTEAFRPYSPILSALAGSCYWWGWVPTCGLTAILSASAIHSWYLPSVPIEGLAVLLVATAATINLLGIQAATRVAVPLATASAGLAFLSALIPIAAHQVDWRQATNFTLTLPFQGWFGQLTSIMAGLYLVGFAAPAFEAAACHVGETVDPQRNVPRAMLASALVASLYFVVLPLVWLGVLGPEPLGRDLATELGPTFAPIFGSAAKAAAIWFIAFNMFHGTLQPLAGAARTLSQLAEDGLLPRSLALRLKSDAPWVATGLTAFAAILFLLIGDPIWLIAAANFTYLIGICLPNVAVWLLRRDAPNLARSYRAPPGTIGLGLFAAAVWGLSAILGFEQYGLPTVIFGLAMAYSGAGLYAWRRFDERRRSGIAGPPYSLHVKLTGAMVAVLLLDGAGYFMAIQSIPAGQEALVTALEDIFVMVALLTISVGLVLPGTIAHAAEQVGLAAHRLVTGTMHDFTGAIEALGRGDLDAATVTVEIVPVVVHSRDEVGEMARNFNALQLEVASAARGLDGARTGLQLAQNELREANHQLQQRIDERTRLIDELIAAREDQAKTEEAFRQAQKMEVLGQMTGGIAHDFNNVLTSVLGALEMLDRAISTDRERRMLAAAIRAAGRGAKLTEQLLAFSRKQRLNPKPVDLSEIVQEIDELLSRTLGGRTRIETDIARPSWRALADPTQIDMILLNLAINARDAMEPAGGSLTIQVANKPADGGDLPLSLAPGDYVLLAVTDTGEGMTEEVRARAFDPFFTTKEPGRGSGLGLSQVHGFVTQSGGTVELDSTVGKGTTVRIYLPRTALVELTTKADEGKPAAPIERSACLLIVDDDNDVREMTATYLTDLGYSVIQAADGRQGLLALEREAPIDAVLADFAMPEMNGVVLARAAWTRRPGLPILLLTGYTAAASAEAGDEAIPLLAKPFKLTDLASAVAALLGPVRV